MISKIDTIYESFNFFCKVQKEEEKLFYSDNFNRLVKAINNSTQNWNFKRFNFEIFKQHLVKNKKGLPIRTTLKNYPTGGYKKITTENIHKLTTLPFEDISHLKFRFENFGVDDSHLYPADNSGLVEFHKGILLASIENKATINELMDLYFLFGDSNRISHDSNNQYCELIIKSESFEENTKKALVNEICEISCTTELYSNYRPFRKVWINGSGVQSFNEITGDTYNFRKSDNSNQFNNIWKKLK